MRSPPRARVLLNWIPKFFMSEDARKRYKEAVKQRDGAVRRAGAKLRDAVGDFPALARALKLLDIRHNTFTRNDVEAATAKFGKCIAHSLLRAATETAVSCCSPAGTADVTAQ